MRQEIIIFILPIIGKICILQPYNPSLVLKSTLTDCIRQDSSFGKSLENSSTTFFLLLSVLFGSFSLSLVILQLLLQLWAFFNLLLTTSLWSTSLKSFFLRFYKLFFLFNCFKIQVNLLLLLHNWRTFDFFFS